MFTKFCHAISNCFNKSAFINQRYLLFIFIGITSSVQAAIGAGVLDVTVANVGNGTLLSGIEIHAMERLSNGSDQWRASGVSDNKGYVRFELPGVGEGRNYHLFALSPVNGKWKSSKELTQSGKYRFNLVGSIINVMLVNGISKQPLTNQKIYAMEKLSDGSLSWVSDSITDKQGMVVFDLDLDSSHQYVMVTQPYNGGWVTSAEITQKGDFVFNVGTFEVKVVNGADGSVMPGIEIHAQERLSDGTSQWRASGFTDNHGMIQFDLPGLGEGGTYFFQGQSPVDDQWKTSKDLTDLGQYTFTLSNAPLNIKLVNGVTNQSLANQEVHVMKRLDDGGLEWIATGLTGSNGHVVFDIKELSSGSAYVLLTQPYNGGYVESLGIFNPGDFTFRVGTLPVTVMDGNQGKPVAGQLLTLLKKDTDGNLVGLKTGTSDSNGIVHFDIPELAKGGFFTVHSKSLDDQKDLFTPWITKEGPIDFTITDNDNHTLDLISPVLKIATPVQGAVVSQSGFVVQGTASDDQELARVEVIVKDPLLGDSIARADFANGYWKYTVPGSKISSSVPISVVVKAFDRMGNSTEQSVVVNSIADNSKPELTILSHNDGDQVTDAGFLVSGTVFDNTEIKQLTATVIDPALGHIVNGAPISVAKTTGNWTLAVNQATAGESINVIVTATDFSGNSVTQNLILKVISVTASTTHLINRITFGATAELIEDARELGFDGFINQQLNPQTINDSALESQLANMSMPTTHIEWLDYLQDFQILHAVYSKRQLLEVMTWFWENHFNTNAIKTWDPSTELEENKLFRQHALGKFRDLLQISATSPAMNIYLDNVFNRKEEPNENWARELLELHTLGIDGGYTAKDIAEVARVFAGWTTENENKFIFEPWFHDNDEKIVLGNLIPTNSGYDGGVQVLDILARHPSTAQFICKKLLNLFVSDMPDHEAIQNCAQDFLSSDGDIGLLVGNILRSSEFLKPKHFRNKVKTPFEFMTGMLRSLRPEIPQMHTRWFLSQMDMPLLQNPIPTGYSEIGADWINSEQLLQRFMFTNRIVSSALVEKHPYISNPASLFLNSGYETAEGVVGYLFELAMANDYSKFEWDQAIGILTYGGAKPFDIHAEDADQRIRELLGTILNYPSYQLQ